MRSAKYIGVFAICGFILSFVSGLFSHSSILSVLLKALIISIVFGLLGFVISVIYNKFLSDGLNGENQSDYSVDASSGSAPLGQNVDITIQDEELRPSESENHFVVGANHQMLNDSDIRASANANIAAENANSSEGFVPLRNFESVKNVSGKESVVPSEVVAENKEAQSVSYADNSGATSVGFSTMDNSEVGIDTLPDMENFVFTDSDNSDSEDDDSGSEIETEFVPVGSTNKNEAPAEVKDAALMAKAISSVLSDEENS